MPTPLTSNSTVATLPSALLARRGLDSVVLRQWLGEVFADFYNAMFDAAYRDPPEPGPVDCLKLLRQSRAQQVAIMDGACADIALMLADPAFGSVVVPINAPMGADVTRSRLWQRRLHDAFLRRCARLPLAASERALLEEAFDRQLVARLVQMSRGVAATDAGAPRPDEAAPRPVDADSSAAQVEQIDRLLSRLRAGGLTLGESDVRASEEPVVDASPEPDLSPPESAPVTPRRAAVSGPILGLLAITLVAALAAMRWYQRPVVHIPEVLPSSLPAGVAHVGEVDVASSTAAPVSEMAAPVPVPQQPAPETGPGTHARVPATPPVIDVPVAAAATEVMADDEAVPLPAVTASASSDERLPLQVDYLLQRAEVALSELRLTEPFVDSAAANYFAVLAIDPEHAEARKGLKRIVERYAELISAALSRGDNAQAALLLQRARSVLPHAPQLQELEAAR